MEHWRRVVGYDTYEVSDTGRVRRLAGYVRSKHGSMRRVPSKILKQATVLGYPTVNLSELGIVSKWKVHRLVAAAFLGPEPLNHNVNHKNGKRAQCHVANLEYVTTAQNNQHAYDVLNKRDAMPRGERNHMAKLLDSDIPVIRQLRTDGQTLRQIGARFNVCIQTISNIVRRRKWQHVM